MITKLYPKYIHKSHVFLYPLLGIKRNAACRPQQTYIRLKGIFRQEDLKLIVVYQNESSARWQLFQQNFLLNHKMLECCVESLDGMLMLYIFDLTHFEADVQAFLRGAYSQYSSEAKQLVADFYGVHSPEWAHIETFLYPSRYYADYAKILDVSEQLLRERGELCPPYDEGKETLSVELPDNFVDQLVIL